MMHKLISYSILLLLLGLSLPRTSARLLELKHRDGQNHPILNDVSFSKLGVKDSTIDELMGLEICGNGDEECLKRRMISEVHLDYIYTQHHKP